MPTLKTQINSMHRGKVACWLWISLLYRNTLCINTRMRTLASQHISKLFLYEVSLPLVIYKAGGQKHNSPRHPLPSPN